MIKRIGDWRLEEELNRGDDPVVVLFVATGVEPCVKSRLDFRNLAQDYFLTRFFEVDLLENPSLVRRHRIRKVPTLAVFQGGVEQIRQTGPWMRTALQRVLGPGPSSEADAQTELDGNGDG